VSLNSDTFNDGEAKIQTQMPYSNDLSEVENPKEELHEIDGVSEDLHEKASKVLAYLKHTSHQERNEDSDIPDYLQDDNYIDEIYRKIEDRNMNKHIATEVDDYDDPTEVEGFRELEKDLILKLLGEDYDKSD
jgi:hypothetical protein